MARLGGTFAVFGTNTETYGIIRNVEKTKNVEENELARGDGEVYAVEQFKEKFDYSGELVLVASGGPEFSNVGDGATFACPDLGDNLYLKSLTQTKTGEDWQAYRFEGTSWPYLGVLPTTTTTS